VTRFVASLGGRQLADAEWLERLRDSVHVWNAVPIALLAVTLTAGGFWLGSAVSSGAATAPTRTVKIEGKVITVNGVKYVSTPARIVRVQGKSVKLPARTVPLAGHTTLLPGHTVVVPTTIDKTSFATVHQTVTVTSPAVTVTGPITTVSDTVTVPVVSTITVTVTGP
jgi:hypothetical protein